MGYGLGCRYSHGVQVCKAERLALCTPCNPQRMRLYLSGAPWAYVSVWVSRATSGTATVSRKPRAQIQRIFIPLQEPRLGCRACIGGDSGLWGARLELGLWSNQYSPLKEYLIDMLKLYEELCHSRWNQKKWSHLKHSSKLWITSMLMRQQIPSIGSFIYSDLHKWEGDV